MNNDLDINSLNQIIRLRRNRSTDWIREMVAETRLFISDLILPIFIIEGSNTKQSIKELPGVYRFSVDLAIKHIKYASSLGIKVFMLFPVIDANLKNNQATESYNENNLLCRAIKAIKSAVPDIGLISDIALDPYTSHGHDGIIAKNNYGRLVIDNDLTIEILKKQALAYVKAGCDGVSPSDMMDGRILAIRKFLDQNAYQDSLIFSYAAKYSSSLYGPFRKAVGSNVENENNLISDKKTYQMDYRNASEAILEVENDIKEGADVIIIKPGIFYMDVISKIKHKFICPIASYQVSGEYAMLKIASEHGIINFNEVFKESLYCLKRAGANSIITYGAIEAIENNIIS